MVDNKIISQFGYRKDILTFKKVLYWDIVYEKEIIKRSGENIF